MELIWMVIKWSRSAIAGFRMNSLDPASQRLSTMNRSRQTGATTIIREIPIAAMNI